ncbi:MAG: DUF5715 family protein [Muribaculum sp.]|nr:DUF5715 family protein [Muribaculum sp.]
MQTFHYILPVGILLSAFIAGCSAGGDDFGKDSYVINFETQDSTIDEPVVMLVPVADSDSALTHSAGLDSVSEMVVDTDSTFFRHLDSMPDINCVKLRVKPLGGSLGRVFNDSNHVQLAAAEKLGIRPIESLSDAWYVKRPLKKVVSCREYFVDNLTHSLPYLVPEAYDLLKEIGSRFNDTLQARGGGSYRIKVTSVLRTATGVKKLRRGNINAVKNSTHQFGTTFDISYVQFICDSMTVNRTQEDLKNLLAEILKEISFEGKCYVKYERKQGCFHITARPVADAVKSD